MTDSVRFGEQPEINENVNETFTIDVSRDGFHTIGRSASSTTLLGYALCSHPTPYKGVSRQHVTLRINEGVVFMQDNKSSNGTFINNLLLETGVDFVITPDKTFRVDFGKKEDFGLTYDVFLDSKTNTLKFTRIKEV